MWAQSLTKPYNQFKPNQDQSSKSLESEVQTLRLRQLNLSYSTNPENSNYSWSKNCMLNKDFNFQNTTLITQLAIGQKFVLKEFVIKESTRI